VLPWWRATAISLGIFALIMFGVMLLTMFEWWRMRRRFVALAAMTDALSRLGLQVQGDVREGGAALAAALRRRRGAVAEGQPRPRMPEEVEIERLNEELKQILEAALCSGWVRNCPARGARDGARCSVVATSARRSKHVLIAARLNP